LLTWGDLIKTNLFFFLGNEIVLALRFNDENKSLIIEKLLVFEVEIFN
jgi:Tfp pilus assembly protein PilZ